MKTITPYNSLKKYFLLCFVVLFVTQILQSQTIPEVLWAKRYGGTNTDTPRDMVTDIQGNIYMTGVFSEKTTFGDIYLTATGTSSTFVTKTDPFGNVLWAKRFGGTFTNSSIGIAIDSLGNVYTTGRFSGTTTFGTFTLEAETDYDIFVAKQDSEGDVLWVSQFTGTQNQIFILSEPRTIITDTQGYIYTAGYFGFDNITFGNITLTRPVNVARSAFVVKQDPFGNVLWAKNFEATKSTQVEKITTDAFDNLYIIGRFGGTVIFGNTTLTNLDETNDLFLAKLDSFGEIIWAKHFDIVSSDTPIPSFDSSDITVDQIGNIYIVGNFYGELKAGSTTLISSSPEIKTPFVIKTNNVGEPLWAKRFTCGDPSLGNGITSDISGNIYITGAFEKNIDFDGITFNSFGSNNPNYPDFPDAFILKMDDLGTVEWAVKYGALRYDSGTAITTDSEGNVLVLGRFELDVNFGTTWLNSAGWSDIFLLKLSESLATNKNKIDDFWAYPNPTNDFITLDFSDYDNTELYAEVFTILGQKIKVFEKVKVSETLDLSELTAGIYLLKITHNGAIQTIKIKKQ